MILSKFTRIINRVNVGSVIKNRIPFDKSQFQSGNLLREASTQANSIPNLREDANLAGKKGLVLGVYTTEDQPNKLSDSAKEFDEKNNNVLCEFLESLESPMTLGQSATFTNLDPDFFNVCLVGVGRDKAGYNRVEELDECKENVRIAAGTGVRKLRESGVTCILVEGFSDPGASAEGAQLAVWRYQDYKAPESQVAVATVDLYGAEDREEWERGMIKATSQNIARELSDTPANCMTPAIFAQTVGDILCPCGIQLEVRDKDWIEAKKMHAFLTVARGSCEHPALLEIGYCGGPVEDKPILLIGKGTTFNTGGICLWQSRGLEEMRADMSGAAVVVSVIKAAASLSLPINIRGVIPLCENMPSGMAVKPGDMVHSMAGKSIMVQDTGREGVLMLADAITYGQQEYKPKLVLDVATLTRGVRDCLGAGATGVFANDDEIWQEMQKAGSITGDRVWRLPLWDHFTQKVTGFPECDLHNVGLGYGGSPCLGAAFLQEFVVCNDWAHLDTFGTGMLSHGEEIAYLPRGRMTGRPMRTILQFLYQMACSNDEEGSSSSS